MPDYSRLQTALDALQEERRSLEERLTEINRAIRTVASLMPLEAHAVLKVSGTASFEAPSSRPRLKQGILFVMRETPDREWDKETMADELTRRGWMAKRSAESVRQVLNQLRGKGQVASSVDTRTRKAIYTLTNQISLNVAEVAR